MGRDHAIECKRCGVLYGGLNDPSNECWNCNPNHVRIEELESSLSELVRVGELFIETIQAGVIADSEPLECALKAARNLLAETPLDTRESE